LHERKKNDKSMHSGLFRPCGLLVVLTLTSDWTHDYSYWKRTKTESRFSFRSFRATCS